jgi:hypothetical protein
MSMFVSYYILCCLRYDFDLRSHVVRLLSVPTVHFSRSPFHERSGILLQVTTAVINSLSPPPASPQFSNSFGVAVMIKDFHLYLTFIESF